MLFAASDYIDIRIDRYRYRQMGDSDIDHDSVNGHTMVVGVPSTRHRKKVNRRV